MPRFGFAPPNGKVPLKQIDVGPSEVQQLHFPASRADSYNASAISDVPFRRTKIVASVCGASVILAVAFWALRRNLMGKR